MPDEFQGLVDLDRRELAAIGGSPRAVAALEAIQENALRANPAAIETAQAVAETAVADAAAADAAAAAAAVDAAAAQATADSKIDQTAGDARYVRQDIGSAWTGPTGTASRATFATYAAPTISAGYVQAEVQAIADHLQILSERIKGLVDDLKANGALT